MSGPKGGCYRVVSAAELRRRALQRAEASMAAARKRHSALRTDAAAGRRLYGKQVPEVPAPGKYDESDPVAVERAAELLDRQVAEFGPRVRKAMGRGRADAITAALDLGEVSGSVSADAEIAAYRAKLAEMPQAGAAVVPAPQDSRLEDITRILGRLDGEVDDDTEAALLELAAGIRAAPSSRRAQDLVDLLREDVQRANRAIRIRRDHEDELVVLAARIEDLQGPKADAARGLLASARSGGLVTAGLRQVVDDAVAAAEAEADRSFVLAEATAVLAELGYEVDQGFETLIVENGYAHLRRSSWPGYAVRVRASTDPARVNFNVVRSDAERSSSQRDKEVEEGWCSDLHQMRGTLVDRGVEIDIDREIPAGAQPVQAVPADELGGSHRRRRTTGLREREM